MVHSLQEKQEEKQGTSKRVYAFEEGDASMKDLLGGKGANLAQMTKMGFPVPPGFTITTAMCVKYYESGKKLPEGLMDDVREKMKDLEKKMGKGFGDPKNPLLVSVRSGAKFSMPGMMDTILNLGLNSETVKGLAELTSNERFAYDAYRRFIHMFSDVVLELPKRRFENILQEKKKARGVKEDSELTAADLKELVESYKKLVRDETKREFPEKVMEQLELSIEAVFRSWNTPRAIVYRDKEKISHTLGTAVNVQSMVFGNMGDDSGTGVAFTRDASTGENTIRGDVLFNAQGEDVVAGIRTPLSIEALEEKSPEIYKQFKDIAHNLETHFRDVQDLEFTMEKGKLFMLQTRNAKRTALAAVTIAVDMVKEGLITKQEAVERITADHIDQLLHPYFKPEDKNKAIADGRLLAKGTAASPGAACGMVVFEADDAVKHKKEGKKVVLVRPETSPDDAHGMVIAEGILTSTGGPTSHAALVARGWGIPCVVGCEAIRVDLEKKEFSVKDRKFHEGHIISFDGGTGEVLDGEVVRVHPTELIPQAKEILSWADEIRTMGVRANADNPKDAQRARSLGAEGIGLCRTEHMFMESDRLPIVQRMILVANEAEGGKRIADRLEHQIAEADEHKRNELEQLLADAKKHMQASWDTYQETLKSLLPIQRKDFEGILEAMEGLWVIIRLLDPPLHEFLPDFEKLLVETTELRITGKDPALLKEREKMLEKVRATKEVNPMLGLRVCRLGIVYPEIYKMQVRAIFEAACALKKRGVDVKPEVMIPGVAHVSEMKYTKEMAEAIAHEIIKREGVELEYKIGTMIELPRACVVAGELAKYAEFFSFGTNDLTQTTLGYSRDDASGTFIPVYLEKEILKVDPFQQLDRIGVGPLMRMAIEQGRATNSHLEVGICGEHGGEPTSVEFCHILGLNYVSCSPFRVPIARLAAAHAKLKEGKK
ncbi:MAG: pyruvate, phosphate dikinase [Candidatus Eremiobacteraeota bacterium]|nr:pyruvate, phosphate dikinase [Candidatus Eremiobacteraeota bacterium]